MTSGDAAALETFEPRTQARLARFTELLLERNAVMNLTAARSAEAVAGHIADSLVLAPLVLDPLVDVGSGGGFPAIPLAIALGCRATLVEAVAKKAAFLREVVAELGLPVSVVTARAEDAARRADLREAFGCATARAVGGPTTVLELTVPFLRVGGLALLQRGSFTAVERVAVADASLMLGANVEDEREAGGDDGRRVLVVRKVAKTGPRFPRRSGIPAKRPLCFGAFAE